MKESTTNMLESFKTPYINANKKGNYTSSVIHQYGDPLQINAG
jgi:hypothetical protein